MAEAGGRDGRRVGAMASPGPRSESAGAIRHAPAAVAKARPLDSLGRAGPDGGHGGPERWPDRVAADGPADRGAGEVGRRRRMRARGWRRPGGETTDGAGLDPAAPHAPQTIGDKPLRP
jgi:hypothetical protein